MRILILCLLAVSIANAQTPEDRTRQALEQQLSGQVDAFYDQFDDTMRNGISRETYKAQIGQLTSQLGKPVSVGAATAQTAPEGTTVTIPVHWSAVTLNFIVSWSAQGKVQGVWFQPAEMPAQQQPAYETAPYAKPDAFTSREVTIGSDEWKLPGTLLIPKGKGPFPAVVLVNGSGPNDRDETMGGVKMFRDLAEGLASRGIAVLRYDKRTRAYPEKSASLPNFTVKEETIDDAVRAAALLRTQEGIDPARVFLVGHSLGGYLMPRILVGDPKAAGAVIMAGNARHLDAVAVEQLAYLGADQATMDALKRDPWSALPGLPLSYRKDLDEYNPVDIAKRSRAPILILQGERDFQVTMTDFGLWKSGLAGRAGVTMRSFPALNHAFVAGEGRSMPAEYDKPAHVAPEAIDAIATWVEGIK